MHPSIARYCFTALLCFTVLAAGKFSSAAPTKAQKDELRGIWNTLVEAGKLYKAGKSDDAARLVREAQAAYDKFDAPADEQTQALLDRIYRSLQGAHGAMQLDGVRLPALKRRVLEAKPEPKPNTPEPEPEPDPEDDAISFSKHIAPMLLQKCGRCHVNDAKGGFSEATFAALAKGSDAGRVIFPGPFCGDHNFECAAYGIESAFTQAAPLFEDLPFDPDIFQKLAEGPDFPTDNSLFQPGAQQETAALFNLDGMQGTRLSIAGHFLTVLFNQLPSDGETWTLHFVRGPDSETVNVDAVRPPMPGMTARARLSAGTNELADADLSRITVVPNPFIAANEIQRGRGTQRILFTQLPPRATIRIYTVSGNLVRILEHSDGSGTAEWDVRTRFDLIVSSGIYYWHVTTPDGRTQLGRLAVVN